MDPPASEHKAEPVLDSMVTAVELEPRSELEITLFDWRLFQFAKEHIRPERDAWNIKYRYKPSGDTLFASLEDSVIVYQYPVDSIVGFYQQPFLWCEYYQDLLDSNITAELFNFIELISHATSCQGIIYSQGDQMIESFSFRSAEEARMAKKHFDGCQGQVFAKTLSFASSAKLNLYVFHARYNYPSWLSKRDHQRFEGSMLEESDQF